ncbi:type II toxin-antitoxin system HicB family antitoxin [Methanoculleus bourgensis]|nr:type II toxin-antitoxin system HicB family antitoxin [Methanoculleus bourgensis]
MSIYTGRLRSRKTSCSAFGETEEEALAEVKVAIGLWLETARQEGREIG